ncbi:FliA/WhiG family RNA polymerase sigma factor [Aquibacillus albus]|uniref:RNA polymerase sigma factor for flagellar operon FliA n=1 Tax=Aquibacillus albus TaxID=1168171 RepID=A0ABS2N155_9BACI|nr:FliA/WhiG family RNA polymerase sigma factor [Aquibacillus albus]MBM7571844.1 RNA polymerase sigma factor for flagellar operon FliA [Aquibacillus albus]
MAKTKALFNNHLWEKWMKTKDNEIADQLIENYYYLVTYHVQRIATHLPSSVSKEDLKSLGLFGLYDALQKFDLKRDLKFDTYASFRIRGAIIDGLRKEDWLPRSIRDKAKKVERVSHTLEQQLQRQPTSHEIAQELGLVTSEVEEIIKDTLFANLLSIEEKVRDTDENDKEGIGYILPDDKHPQPEIQIVDIENYQELEQAIQQLNENEQMVLSLFYKEELTLTEIGQVLDLTTSRISQIHKQAIFKLRTVLAKRF